MRDLTHKMLSMERRKKESKSEINNKNEEKEGEVEKNQKIRSK